MGHEERSPRPPRRRCLAEPLAVGTRKDAPGRPEARLRFEARAGEEVDSHYQTPPLAVDGKSTEVRSGNLWAPRDRPPAVGSLHTVRRRVLRPPPGGPIPQLRDCEIAATLSSTRPAACSPACALEAGRPQDPPVDDVRSSLQHRLDIVALRDQAVPVDPSATTPPRRSRSFLRIPGAWEGGEGFQESAISTAVEYRGPPAFFAPTEAADGAASREDPGGSRGLKCRY